MKRKILVILFFLFLVVRIFATEQEADILHYKNKELYLQTGWGHLSPLETYFIQENIESPFKMISTANYRGFIATWKIKNKKLYLTHIDDEKSKSNQLHSVFKNSKKKTIFADWFSGMIVADDFLYVSNKYNSYFEYYIYVKKGKVQKVVKVDIFELFDKEKYKCLNSEIKEMVSLNYRYISYYYRLWGNDSIRYKDNEARIWRKRGTSLILAYFSEDNLLWPYNWENEKLYGAPHCDWSVVNNRVYLKSILLYSGTSFDGADIEPLPLNTLFSGMNKEQEVFADWLNGVFIIQYGYDVKEDYYTRFEITENILISIKDGVVVEEYKLGKDFNFSKKEKKYSRTIELLLNKL